MSRAGRRNTNKYRQVDPSTLRLLGQPVDAQIAAVTTNPDDNTQARVFFSTAINRNRHLVTGVVWTIGAANFDGWDTLASDGMSILVNFDAPIAADDAYDFAAIETTPGIEVVNGGTISASTGTVVLPAEANKFNLTGIEAHAIYNLDLTFDQPIASILVDGVAVDQADFTGWDFGGLTVDHVVTKLGADRMRLYMTSAVTSGLTFTIATDTNTFVSIQGATLNATTGEIT